jgi:hypothetical protein
MAVVPEPQERPAYAGTHTVLTPAKAPSSGSKPGDVHPISGVMQHLDLTDAALIKELADITGNDRYPFSPRIQTLRAILAKLRPEPAREPLPPPPKVYAPPRASAAKRRRASPV